MSKPHIPHLIVLDDPQAVIVRAAEELTHISGEAICTHGQFTIALSGGSTPAAMYELLAVRFRLSVDWKEVQFFFGDERCVPPDHELSNYGMANHAMLSPLGIKPEQIHRIKGELKPQDGAIAYEEELRKFFSLRAGEFPRFDLVLLGLGANAHTASLFPGDPAIHETARMAVAVEVDDSVARHRISLTPPVLNNATRIMFVAHGAEKAAAVHQTLEAASDPDRFPAQIIAPPNGEAIWILDRQAAGRLSGR
jgi:6-phosphogluconolactonase